MNNYVLPFIISVFCLSMTSCSGNDEPKLYPSVEEKAAMLLYLVTKKHSFSDGNKRIAATLFLWFLITTISFIAPMVANVWQTIPL